MSARNFVSQSPRATSLGRSASRPKVQSIKPDKKNVKLTISVWPELHEALTDCTKLFGQAYGAKETVTDFQKKDKSYCVVHFSYNVVFCQDTFAGNMKFLLTVRRLQ